MIKDISDVLPYRTPVSLTKRNLGVYRQSFSRHVLNPSKGSSIATKLDFSFLEDSANSMLDTSSISECNSLKRKLKSVEAELLVSNAKIKDKEGVISLMEPANKKVCMHLENELENCKRQNELDQEKIRELKSQIRRLSGEEADAKSKLIESEKQRKIECDNKECQISSLKIEIGKLKSEIVEAKSEKAETVKKLNCQIASLELELATATNEVEQSKEYIQILNKQLQEQSAKSTLAAQLQKELNNSQVKVKCLESKLEADKEASLIARTMQSELKMLPELKKENQRIKGELNKHKDNNVLLLEEKIWSLQEKLNQAEKKSTLLAKAEAENEHLKEKIAVWESLMDDKEKSGYKSPSTFSRKLSEYQKNELLLTNKVANLTSHCRNLNSTKNKLEATVVELNKENTNAKHLISSYENTVKLCKRKVFLLTKEQESSRKLIDSYITANSDTTFCGSNFSVQYVRTLEESLAAYKTMLEELQSEKENTKLQQSKEDVKKSGSDADISMEIQKLRDENADLLLKINEVKAQKHSLEEQLSTEKQTTKSHDRSFKVVHLRHNPLDDAVQQRKAEFHRLQDENDRLRKRIKVLEEEGVKAVDVTLKVEEKLNVEGSTETIQGLTKKLNEAEKRYELLKESFRKTSQELREACYMLTGFKIELFKNTYKLFHMYADSPEDYLVFQLSSEGSLSLLENQYTANLKDKIDTYLLRYDSIPAFLASLTMDLFSHQTCVIMDKD